MSRYPQPIALLERLGVDERHEGQGLGAALLPGYVADSCLTGGRGEIFLGSYRPGAWA